MFRQKLRFIISLFASLLMCIAIFPVYAEAPEVNGDWKDVATTDWYSDEPGTYNIENETQLAGLIVLSSIPNNKTFENQTFVLTKDLNLSGKNWESIREFSGTFDGDGHVIDGLSLDGSTSNTGALFHKITDEGNVKNLGLTNVNIVSNSYETQGALVNKLMGKIQNVYTTGSFISKKETGIAGIVGEAYYGAQIKNVYSTMDLDNTINGGGTVAGIIVAWGAVNEKSLIENAWFGGSAKTNNDYIASGIIGQQDTQSSSGNKLKIKNVAVTTTNIESANFTEENPNFYIGIGYSVEIENAYWPANSTNIATFADLTRTHEGAGAGGTTGEISNSNEDFGTPVTNWNNGNIINQILGDIPENSSLAKALAEFIQAQPFIPDTPAEPVKVEVKYPMYRVYNANSGEHFYTKNVYEKETLVIRGWKDEGISWLSSEEDETPVYRVYNPNAGEHHYTTSPTERDMLVSVGWKDEGIGWYSDTDQGVAIYRLYNPNAYANNHHYTSNTEEKDWLVSLGWKYEGIGWYGELEG